MCSVGASSDFTSPYAYEDDADDGVYRIQVGPNPASIGLDDVNDDEEEDDDENRDDDETQTLWTHVYIPENEPAPYAESFNSGGGNSLVENVISDGDIDSSWRRRC